MNANRRKQIDKALALLQSLEYQKDTLAEIVQGIKEEEEEAFDNMPESLQETERGEAIQEAIDNLENALDSLECLDFEEIADYLTEAQA